MTLIFSESAETQYQQSEERANKFKQLLVKSKRDLAEAKKTVSGLLFFQVHFVTSDPTLALVGE